ALIFRFDVTMREELAVLITLLLFEEVSLQPEWCEDLPAQSWALFSLPWVIVDRFCLPFKCSTHHLVSPNRTTGPSVDDPLTVPHIVASLRLSWHLAWHEDVKSFLRCDISTSNKCLPPILHITSADLRALAVCSPFAGLRSSLDQLTVASSHHEAHAVLASLHIRLLSDHLLPTHSSSPYTDALLELPFIKVFQRFVLVRPANRADGVVLADVLHLLASLVHAQGDAPEASFILHLLNLLEQDGCPLLDLLCGFVRDGIEESVSPVLHRAVLELYGVLLDSVTCTRHRQLDTIDLVILICELVVEFYFEGGWLTHTEDNPVTIMQECSLALKPFRGKLVDTLLERLREAESQSFYDLPLLEAILLALVHASAVLGWSVHSVRFALPRDMHLGLLSALQEVILSFSIGREGNCTSFLGKGVTRSALQCLYQLAHEMRFDVDGDDWVELWCSPRHIGTGSNPPGLTWLLTLWVDRDPEVRVSSLAIAAVLTTTESGCRALLAACRGIPGGLWGTALNILLDHAECSLVRCQVASILQNLLAVPHPSLTDDVQDELWQDPCVHDDQLDISLVGRPALLALLVHCNFYSFLTLALSSVYLDTHLADRPAASGVIMGSGALDSASIAALDGEEEEVPLKDTHSDNATSSTWLSSLSMETNDATTPPTEEMQHRNVSYPTNRLSAQGQSDSEPGVRPSNGSRDLHRENSKTDGQAVITAALAAALCHLVGNVMVIAPDETSIALESYGVFGALIRWKSFLYWCCDKQVLQSILKDLQNVPLGVPRHRGLNVQVQGFLDLFCSLCTLWRTCAILCPTHFLRVHSLRDICDIVFSELVLTSMPGTPCDVEDVTRASWVHGLDLLSTLARVHEADLLKTFTSMPIAYWEGFFRCMELCLKDTSQVEAMTAALHCLAAMLVAEGKLVLKGRSIAESSELRSFSFLSLLERGTTIPELPGFSLCKLLMKRYQRQCGEFAVVDNDTSTTLCLLLSISPSAKQAALQAGLIVQSIDRLNELHDRLNLAPPKASNGKKDNPVMKEVRNILTLLRNCLYSSEEIKLAAIQESTLPMLLSLWPWLLTSVDVLHAALHLLCVLTANCPSACTACCSVVHNRTPTCQSGARGSS
uniref:rotatin-like n=1 Tax=Myxine glutinosa TaxID=7769 RepID=UPI00358E3341